MRTKVILFGAGNVATHLGKALQEAGHNIMQVWSRNLLSAQKLADRLGCQPHTFDEVSVTTDTGTATCSINSTTDYAGSKVKEDDCLVCIISVKDDAIEEVARRMMPHFPKAIWAHTAGSVSIDTLTGKGANRVGVFYPMQTFSKDKEVDFKKISIFIEGTDCISELKTLAQSISPKVYELNGKGRRYLHLAAVFCCNFVNHCYTLGETVLRDADIPFDVMLPLIDETADKVHHLLPQQAQTGPAARHDKGIMASQHDILETDSTMQKIYDLMSESIEKSTQ